MNQKVWTNNPYSTSQLQISNLVSSITRYRLSWRPGVSQETFGSWILASGSWILDYELWIMNCELWMVIMIYDLWFMIMIYDYDLWLWLMIIIYDLWLRLMIMIYDYDYDLWLWFMTMLHDYDLSQTPFARSTRHTHRHFLSFRIISFCITVAVIP